MKKTSNFQTYKTIENIVIKLIILTSRSRCCLTCYNHVDEHENEYENVVFALLYLVPYKQLIIIYKFSFQL